MEKTPVASGIEQLDDLLGGLYIGDNVVWHDDAGSLASVFYMNFLNASRIEEKPIIYASFDRSPKVLMEKLGRLTDYPGLTVLDCFTEGKGASSPLFLKFYEEERPAGGCRIIRVDRPHSPETFSETLYGVHAGLKGDVRLVFESLTGMQELWGGEDQLISFYAHACPRLYELETVAYWVLEKNAHSQRLRAQITQIAQVVIDLSIKRGTTSLSILKAENRSMENLQKPYHYWAREMVVGFDTERRTAGLDLGQRLRELRSRRGFSQTELARLVGVTPSTISQVESNLIYPSLPALLKMAEVLSVEISSLFREGNGLKKRAVFGPDDRQPCRLAGQPEGAVEAFRLTPLDFEGQFEPYLLEIQSGAVLTSHFFFHKGEEFGYVLSGSLEARIEQGVQTLHPGDIVYLTVSAPSQWKSTGPEVARILWLKLK